MKLPTLQAAAPDAAWRAAALIHTIVRLEPLPYRNSLYAPRRAPGRSRGRLMHLHIDVSWLLDVQEAALGNGEDMSVADYSALVAQAVHRGCEPLGRPAARGVRRRLPRRRARASTRRTAPCPISCARSATPACAFPRSRTNCAPGGSDRGTEILVETPSTRSIKPKRASGCADGFPVPIAQSSAGVRAGFPVGRWRRGIRRRPSAGSGS